MTAASSSCHRWAYFFDDAGKLLWLFGCNHVAAGQHADIQAMVAQSFSGFDDLVWFKNVAFTAHDMERHRSLQREVQAT